MNTNSNNVLRYIIYVLLGLALFVPLIVANWMFFPFITMKAFAFRALIEVAFGLWVILAFRDPNARVKMTPLFWGITAFTVVAFIVDLTGMNPIRSLWSNFERMEGWITIIHLWAYFVVFSSVIKTRKVWHWFMNISFIPATIIGLQGVFQLYTAALAHQPMPRLDLELGNAEYLAVYMLFNAFFALYLAKVSWQNVATRAWVWLYGVLSFLFVVTIVGSLTRGTMLALVGSAFLMLLGYAILAPRTSRVMKPAAIGIVALIVVLCGGFYLVRNAHFVQESSVLSRIASISPNNARLQYIWPMAWKGFKAKPILGYGQENFNYVFNDYYDPNAWGQEQWFDRAHDTFIDWAMNGGIIGLAAYLAIFVLFALAVWKKNEKGEWVFDLNDRLIWSGLLAAYIVHDIFVFDNLASYMMFFMTLAFLQGQWPLSSQKKVAGSGAANGATSAPAKPFMIDPEAVNWIVAPIVLIVVVFLLYFINYRPYKQNVDLINALVNCEGVGQQGAPALDPSLFTQALDVGSYVGKQEVREQLYSCAEQVIDSSTTSDQDKYNYYNLTGQQAAAQAQATPNDLRGFLFAGSFFDDLGQWNLGLPYLQRAYELSQVKQSILFALGQNYITGATAAASSTDGLALIAKAYNEAPAYSQAQITYAQALFVTGNYADSAKIYQQIIAANPSDTQDRIGLAAADVYTGNRADAIAQLQYVASSSVSSASAAQTYINQIKAGKNPFATASSTK